MSELYVWQVLEDGEWGAIAAQLPDLDVLAPLYTRSRDLAVGGFRMIAERHRRTTGLPIRLARYELAEVEVTIDG